MLKVFALFAATAALFSPAGIAFATPSVVPPSTGDGSGLTFTSPRQTIPRQTLSPAISHRSAPIRPEAQEAARESFHRASTAAADLHAGRYAQSETEAREALSVDSTDGVAEEVLAAALDAQGKEAEALQQYQIVTTHDDSQPRNLLPYALLLLKSGQWVQAVTLYNQVLPRVPDVGPHLEDPIVHDGDLIRANSRFISDVPEPTALATALHLVLGMNYNATCNWGGRGAGHGSNGGVYEGASTGSEQCADELLLRRGLAEVKPD